MRLHRLEIEGYRGFEKKVTIDFPAGNTPMVLVGVNGSGKTAVLDAIAWNLGQLKTDITPHSEEKLSYQLETHDINNDSTHAKCKIGWSFFGETVEHSVFGGGETMPSSWTLKILSDKLRASLVRNKHINIPIYIYYPTLRSVTKEALKPKDISKYNQTDSWITNSNAFTNFNDFFQWFRNREDLENEKRLYEDDSYSDFQLNAIKVALKKILEGFSKPRVRRTFPQGFVIHKHGQELALNQLSHGEKMLLALVGDIARRLALANPSLDNPLEGKGVVLIDEVDLHLHPTWQRTIIKKLTETFPNIQFVVTTHSPLIVSHLKKESIYLLKDNDVQPWKDEAFNPYGAEPEDILKIIQGVDNVIPDFAQQKFNKLFELIDNDKFEEAKKFKKELEQLVDRQHPSLLRAETDIQFKTLIG